MLYIYIILYIIYYIIFILLYNIYYLHQNPPCNLVKIPIKVIVAIIAKTIDGTMHMHFHCMDKLSSLAFAASKY